MDAAVEKTVFELTRDQIVTRIERGAKQRLGLGAPDFIKMYQSGELENPGAVADLLALAALLRDDDPLFVHP